MQVHKEINSIPMAINNKRSSLSLDIARTFAIGDLVLVDRRNLTLKANNRPTNIWDHVIDHTHTKSICLAKMRLHGTHEKSV